MAKGQRDPDIPRLCETMRRARLGLRKFREVRTELVRQYVGKHWSEEGNRERVPVNLIARYIQIMVRNLIAKNPRVLLTTFQRGLKPVVSAMESWANQEIERQYLAETYQRLVTDALFSIGIAKVCLATPDMAVKKSWGLLAGQPYLEVVDLDDFVFDMHAHKFDEVGFIGHRYRVPIDVVKDSRIYSKARKQLTPAWDNPYNLEGDERVNIIGRSYYNTNDIEYEDMVDLWEVYLPRERLVVTLPSDTLTGPAYFDEPLRVQQWLGPYCGPYHILSYLNVPGNAMAKGPLQDLLDLHEASNSSLRKIIRVSNRLKELSLVRSGAAEDGERVRTADDGDMIPVDDPRNVGQVVMSGQHLQTLIALFTQFKGLFSEQGGNLELLSGAGPQSKTATQDELLNQNATAGVADLQERTIAFVAATMKSLLWYWWHDPQQVMTTSFSLPGLPNVAVPRQVTPQQRQQGRFEDLQIRVDPYSLRYQSPQQRLATLNQVMMQVISPLLPLLQQQGINVDMQAYLQLVARYADMPDLQDILTITQPPATGQDSSGAGAGQPRMPAASQRTYTRENVSTKTKQGQDAVLINTMMGGRMQPKDTGAMTP